MPSLSEHGISAAEMQDGQHQMDGAEKVGQEVQVRFSRYTQ